MRPPQQEFYPPSSMHLPVLEGYLQEWGGWGVYIYIYITFGPVVHSLIVFVLLLPLNMPCFQSSQYMGISLHG